MINWKPNPACNYKFDYEKIFADIAQGIIDERGAYRSLILNDIFFIVQFLLEIPPFDKHGEPFCNHPFVVDRCNEISDENPDDWHLDLWARWHFKSASLTKARTIQRICKYPERCTMIVSHTRPAAKKHMRPIMLLMENSAMLKQSFPDVFYPNPRSESPKWSEDEGCIVKRKNMSRTEATLEAWGIKEGMPIGVHFDYIILDDLETKDDVVNPDVVYKIRDAVDLTDDLRTKDGVIDVVGTPYSHEGIYIPFVRDKVRADGSNVFTFRKYPATDDGTPNGKPVFMSQAELDDIRSRKGEYVFNTQQLINPTPVGVRKLEGMLLKDIDPKFIPNNIVKFMAVDPAGDDTDGSGDSWAMLVVGVEPKLDDLGASRMFILDAIISPMREEEAPEDIARMYVRGGFIMQMGVEKVGQSTAEIHVSNALAKRGRHISVDNGSLVILRPAGRNKIKRIESTLAFPLYNNKLFISTDVPVAYRERIRMEMDKFPYWHDDGLDALSYVYDMVKDYKYGWFDDEGEEERKVVNIKRNKTTGY